MNSLSWWNQSRHRYALPAACLASALVWISLRIHLRTTGVEPFHAAAQPPSIQSVQSVSIVPSANQHNANSEEPGSERTPEPIAEILRTDPRGSQIEDRNPVWAFLQKQEGRASGMESEWLLGADEALSWLCGATQAAQEVETGLIALALDSQLCAPLREYALQHLGQWSEEHTAGPKVRDALKNVITNAGDSSLAGTALAALSRSCFENSDHDWLQSEALRLASSENAHPMSRSVALQLLAQSRTPEAEPLARALLRKGGTVPEKISALQLLGQVGTADTLGWLDAFSEETEPLTAAEQRKTMLLLRSRFRQAD
jgi:hypothetical protein